MPETTMNNGSRAVADDGASKMVSGDLPQGATVSDTGHDAVSQDASMAAPVAAPDLVHAPVALRLRAAREAMGLTVAEVAARTRITLRHVEALEAGDYAALPGRPYALGFARGYARAVGLDGTAIADAVRVELQGSAARPESRVLHQFEVGDPAKTPSRLVLWLALVLFGGVLAMGAIFWRSHYIPAVALPSLTGPPEQRVVQHAQIQAKSANTVPGPATTSGAVVFTALEEGIWVKFYDGQGKQLMQKQLARGESYTVPADVAAPKLWTGRPDALAITIGGQSIARLAEAERVMKDVPVDAASLRRQASSAAPAIAPSAGISPPASNP
jgi:transcriptional regulator with XRE-family HTH domain